MSFVFPILLGGLALVGIPVLIHLIMRQKPKTLPFPAFRFLLQRHRTNLRKLQLRHLVLLALRILLIAILALALARPKVSHQGLHIGGDQPVAAVLVFDTSLSMEYRATGNVSRLDEAKQRGLELLGQLPEGSRVAVLDSAESVVSTKSSWYPSLQQARERINLLALKGANVPVSERVETAFRLLAALAQDRDDERSAHLPRLVFVFTDRTKASWDVARLGALRDASDQVPATLAGLKQAAADIPTLIESLGDLRKNLPPGSGQDYADQSLKDALETLKNMLPNLTREDVPPGPELAKAIDGVRRRTREVIDQLLRQKDVPDTARDYRDKLLVSLHTTLGDVTGYKGFLVDVGIDQPRDLALVDLNLPTQPNGQPRQVFVPGEDFVIQAVVQASGKEGESLTGQVTLQVDGKVFSDKQVDIKAGERFMVPLAINDREMKLSSGPHAVEAQIKTRDGFLGNNSRFATFAFREPRKILVLTDEPGKADFFVGALPGETFSAEVMSADRIEAFQGKIYSAVILFGVKQPSLPLWQWLEVYVAKGGGLGVIPGGDEMVPDAYNVPAAQKLLPAKIEKIVDATKTLPMWDLDNPRLQDSLLHVFWKYRSDKGTDFILTPPRVMKYWEVKPQAKDMVLVHYADKKNDPALLVREVGAKKGNVVLATTTLDLRDPPWNTYQQKITSFYLVLVGELARYLAGDEDAVQLNFILGKDEPKVPLPVLAAHPYYLLRGPDMLEKIKADEGRWLTFKQPFQPGNFSVEGEAKDNRFQAGFSVNISAEESDLSRVPITDIEAVLGADGVLPAHRQAEMKDILRDHWTEPVELFPSLMVLLLFVLAVENLLANKFYRKDNQAPAEKQA